jgi:PAS domain S-box-containing protein
MTHQDGPRPAAGPGPPEADDRYRVLVQHVTDHALYLLDPQGHITLWTDGAARVTGYAVAEAVGRHFSLFFPPEEIAKGVPEIEMRTAEAEGRVEREGYRLRKGGQRFWANETLSAVRGPAGRLTGFVKISRDQSDRKRIEDALRESEARHRLLVESARDHAIFSLDADGRIVSWNPGAERIFGYAVPDIVGRPCGVLFTSEDVAAGEHSKELAAAAADGRASDDRWQVRRGGERFWASGVSSAMRDEDGRLLGFTKVLRDLTEAKRTQEQRDRLLERERIARLEAERAIAVKDEFLAVVSHELRTPLTAILIWAKMLRAGNVEADRYPQVFETIEQSAVAQQQLIEDLLDVSRMMSGQLRLGLRESDLAPVVRAAVDTVRPAADAKGVVVEAILDERAGRVRADPDRIRQVVWNLVSNAVKFTPKGGRVDVSLRRVDGDLRIRVTDTGRGIGREFLPHLFERFRQADAGTARAHGGLGLGLAIARQLVELHGGTVRAQSPGEGQGSTFTVDLPLADVRAAGSPGPAAAEAAAGPPPTLAGARVLLVEDDEATRTVFQWVLRRAGADVTAVGSAALAAAAFREGLRGHRYDAVVSDVGMPLQDGYDLMREIREMERQRDGGRSTPAVAVSAYATDEHRARAAAAGFQAHLAKPIDAALLVEAVTGLVGRGGDSPAV